jgi:FkbM family methyltransferase
MTERGHTVIHYGHADSDLICTEHVSVITNDDWEIAYGGYDWKKNFFKYSIGDHAYQTFYTNAAIEISKRKQKNDFLLPFWGSGVKFICDVHENDMIVVEPGIGYAGGHWARWKVWESYAIMHANFGLPAVGTCMQDWYNVVIPNYFDLDDFEFSEEKDDYFLFLGRVYSGKGIDVAIQVTEKLGKKLIIAGQNPDNLTFPSNVEFVGYADIATRKRLMSRAKAAFVPSMYIEPFGGVQIEMLLSGTPTITTDWGSFTENNINGLTGYRCNTFDQFVTAAKIIDKINPKNCRAWGENFSLEKVGPIYEEYFQNILNVYTGKGWYEENKTRTNLSFCERVYPTYPSRKKIYLDCGTHLFQGFKQFSEKLDLKYGWETYCFESNPIVYEKSKPILAGLLKKGYKITHQNIGISDKEDVVKVNCAHSWEGDYTHLGSNILENPPLKDIRYDDNFEYTNEDITVNTKKLSNILKEVCTKDDHVVLKLDIEGSEFAVIDDLINTGAYEFLDEIYVEFHERFFEDIEYYKNKIENYKEFFKSKHIKITEDGTGVVWDL